MERRGNLYNKNPSHFLPPKERCSTPKPNLFLLLFIALLPYPSSYKKPSICKTPRSALPVSGRDTALFMWCLIKPISSWNLLVWILFFNNLCSTKEKTSSRPDCYGEVGFNSLNSDHSVRLPLRNKRIKVHMSFLFPSPSLSKKTEKDINLKCLRRFNPRGFCKFVSTYIE